MKVFKIAQNHICRPKAKKLIKQAMPIAAVPIVAYTLRTQKDTIDYVGDQLLKGFSPDRRLSKNLSILDELEKKNIIEHERAWDPPRFDDAKLTDSTYNGIVAKIQSTRQLNSAQKERYLKELARANDKRAETAFKGAEDTASSADIDSSGIEDTVDLPDTDIPEVPETVELTDTDVIDELAENAILLEAGAAVTAEIIPFARFIKPAKDFVEGDTEKAFAGTATRAFDMLFSPVKFVMATTAGLTEAALGLALDDKELTFKGGFKEFYNSWAKGRDDLENEFLGRPTKDELIEQKRKELIQQQEQKRAELKLKQDEAKKIRQQKELEQYERLLSNYQSNANKPDSWLERKRNDFRYLLNELKSLDPNANLLQYEGYYRWNENKLSKNAENLKKKIAKCKRLAMGVTKSEAESNPYITKEIESTWVERDRENFRNLLAELKYLKPDTDISRYDNYYKWNAEKLERNAKFIRGKIDKYRNK